MCLRDTLHLFPFAARPKQAIAPNEIPDMLTFPANSNQPVQAFDAFDPAHHPLSAATTFL